MIRLDAATVLLQWSVGGLFFLWFTTRRREVGLGYGWLLRGTYLLMPPMCTEWWFRPVSSAARVGEHSAVVCHWV